MKDAIFGEQYLNYQTERNFFRKTIRKLFLWQVKRHVTGNAIDFGCGAGEYLAVFEKDSLGLEINEAAVKYCIQKGLNVQLYKPNRDNYELKEVQVGKYQTLILSHVLEHLDRPDIILKKLMTSCKRLGIIRILITVPCEAGFAHDKTHRTFITKDFIRSSGLEHYGGFMKVKWGYFPFNLRFVGKLFTYNEFYIVYDML